MFTVGTFSLYTVTLQYKVFKVAKEMLTWCLLLADFQQSQCHHLETRNKEVSQGDTLGDAVFTILRIGNALQPEESCPLKEQS